MHKRDTIRIANDDRLDEMLFQSTTSKYDELIDSSVRNSSLCALLQQCLKLDGDIIECGVFRGESARAIVQVISAANSKKRFYAADSYQGFPNEGVTEKDTTLFRSKDRLGRKFRIASDVPDRLDKLFKVKKVDGFVVKGFFEETIASLKLERICFLHLDSDTYSSHMLCLTELYDKIVTGGIIVFDDYRERKWPGASEAIHEFFDPKGLVPKLDTSREKAAWYIQKPHT